MAIFGFRNTVGAAGCKRQGGRLRGPMKRSARGSDITSQHRYYTRNPCIISMLAVGSCVYLACFTPVAPVASL